MVMSDFICVNLVVVSVRPDKTDPTNLVVVIELDYQAILVPFDVEHDSVILQYARTRIFLLERIDVLPFPLFGFSEPHLQLFFAVCVLRPELP